MRGMLDIMALRAGTAVMERGTCRPVDLIAEAIERVRPAATRKKVSLDGLVGEVGQVLCDRSRVVEILAQLLTNAIEASPARKSIAVRVERRDRFVLITVSDEGPGIDANEWSCLFEGVWQTPGWHTREGHDGLGLALCAAAVHAHGGDIGVHSRIGVGTTVFFTLPDAA
jgi:signal transduction histidine kinase